MTTTILLIRHGETAWNAERRLQGHIDINLNDTGRRQAALLADALAATPLDAIVASDLVRAHDTAAAVAARHGLAIDTQRQLRERCYGAFEGMTHPEIRHRYPAEYVAWQAREVDAVMPSGVRVAESFRQFYQRSVAALAACGERYPGQTIAVVAHGGVLECAHRAAAGGTLGGPRDVEIKNASINRFSYADGKLVLLRWGDVDHLAAPAIDELG